MAQIIQPYVASVQQARQPSPWEKLANILAAFTQMGVGIWGGMHQQQNADTQQKMVEAQIYNYLLKTSNSPEDAAAAIQALRLDPKKWSGVPSHTTIQGRSGPVQKWIEENTPIQKMPEPQERLQQEPSGPTGFAPGGGSAYMPQQDSNPGVMFASGGGQVTPTPGIGDLYQAVWGS